jgi:hypothetical protein
MATVPGILYLGGYQGQGPQPPIKSGDPTYELNVFNQPSLVEYVPGGASEPFAPVFFPWYDPTANATTLVASAATSSTISVAGTPWTTNQWVGRTVTVLRDYLGIPGAPKIPDQTARVLSNTANTITIVGAWGTTPAVGASFRVGVGRFEVYTAAPGSVGFFLPPFVGRTLGGAFAQGGTGAGWDVLGIREFLLRCYPSAPYFHAVKWVETHGIASGWLDGGPARATFDAELARIDAAAAERGNTIAWQLAILDLCQEDMRQAGATLALYPANLLALITWLKTRLNAPGLQVQLVSPAPEQLSLTKPGAAAFVRSIHDQFLRDYPNVAVVDMAGEPMGRTWQHPSDGAADLHFYEQASYFRQGQRFARTWQRQLQGQQVSGAKSKAIPIIGLFGDSIVGGQTPSDWTVLLQSPSLTGTRPSTQRIYNRVEGALQAYNPGANSNRSGDVNLLVGLELSITDELAKLFPDGFILVKRGASSSSLSSTIAPYSGGQGGRWELGANEHWPEFLADVRAASALAFAEGYSPDFVGAIVSLGTNDTSQTGDGAKFALALPLFVQHLRQALTTRTAGKFAISWRRPQTGVLGRITAEVEAVRAALAAQASDAAFKLVNVDDLERRTDGVHETPASMIESGRRLVQAIATLVTA